MYFNLGEAIPNITDWIQALCAVSILFLTWKMKNYAKDALYSWKHQDKHSAIVKLIENCPKMHKKLQYFRSTNSKVLSEKEQMDLLDNYRFNGSVLINLENQKRKFEMEMSTIEEIESLSNLAIVTLERGNPLREFYVTLHSALSEIQNGNFIYKAMLDQKEAFDLALHNLDIEIIKLKNGANFDENVIKKYESKREELLNNQNKDFIEKWHQEIFHQPFNLNDTFAQKLDILYKKANLFRDEYHFNHKN